MPFLRKYNTLLVTGTTSIRIPIIKRAVVDFAVGADWTPAAGDVKVFVDAAAVANITNLPTAIASGNGAFWEFILTGAELTCKQLLVVVSDAATKAVEDQSFIVETYGNASAMYAADLSLANLPANVTQLLGTAWLAPGTAGTPDVNTKLWNGLTTVALPLIPTTAGRTLDCSAGGEAGLDWANIGSPTTAQNLSATNIDVDQVVASVSGTVATVTTLTNLPSIPANWLTAAGTATDFGAELATAIWTDTTASDFTTALSVGKSVMNGVALGTGLTINAYTGNTVQTGDSFGRIGVAGAGLTNIDLPNQTMDITGNITGNLSGSVGSVTGAVGSVTGAVGSVTGLTASNLDTTVSSRATPAQVNTEVLDVLNTDTFAEPPQEAPAATTTLVKKIGYLFKAWRNKSDQTATLYQLYNDDAATVDHKATVSDNGTTFVSNEKAAGP